MKLLRNLLNEKMVPLERYSSYNINAPYKSNVERNMAGSVKVVKKGVNC